MTDTVCRMVLFQSLSEPRHTAFKTNKGRTAHRTKERVDILGRKINRPLSNVLPRDTLMQH